MKKVMFKNKEKSKKCHVMTDETSADGMNYPLLFCSHTWTKSVPICVIYNLIL